MLAFKLCSRDRTASVDSTACKLAQFQAFLGALAAMIAVIYLGRRR